MKITLAMVATLLAGSTRVDAQSAEACTLLTRADVEAIAGRPMAEGAKPPMVPPVSADVTLSMCSWTTPDGDDPIGVTVRTSKKGDSEPAFARQTAVDAGMRVEDVSGVGDVAFWTGLQLQVFRGKNVQLVVQVMGHREPKEKAVQVARKALLKL
jgi:hypothetical protein